MSAGRFVTCHARLSRFDPAEVTAEEARQILALAGHFRPGFHGQLGTRTRRPDHPDGLFARRDIRYTYMVRDLMERMSSYDRYVTSFPGHRLYSLLGLWPFKKGTVSAYEREPYHLWLRSRDDLCLLVLVWLEGAIMFGLFSRDTVLCEHFDREVTILADGTVTTCCVDNRGLNRFASIYEHSFDETMRMHRETKRKYVSDASQTPACATCLNNWQSRPYMYKDSRRVGRFTREIFFPAQFVLEVTSRCNARCQTCIHNLMANDLSSVRSGTNGFLDLDRTTEWLRPVWGKLKRLRMYNYGEPFLHKGLEDFCADMKQKSPGVSIGISSNGTSFGSDRRIHKIIDSGMDAIIVSLHGGTADLSRRYMGQEFPFEKAIDNIRRMMAAKRARGASLPVIDLKCVLFEWNDSEEAIQKFADLAEELDVDAYHFWPTGGPIGTKRLPPGGPEWKAFVAAGHANVNRRKRVADGFATNLVDAD